MTVLFIILILLFVFVLLLLINVRINIAFVDELCVYVKFLFVKYRLFPQKDEKPDPDDFSLKKLKKKKKKLKKEHKKSEKGVQKKSDVKSTLSLVYAIVKDAFEYLGKTLKVELSVLHIKVGTDDAAKTALLYAAVSQTAAYILGVLDSFTDLRTEKTNSVSVVPDFVNGENSIQLDITLKMRLWQALILAMRILKIYNGNKMKGNSNGKQTERHDQSNA